MKKINPNGFTGEFYYTFKERNVINHKISSRKQKKVNTYNSLYYTMIFLIEKKSCKDNKSQRTITCIFSKMLKICHVSKN